MEELQLQVLTVSYIRHPLPHSSIFLVTTKKEKNVFDVSATTDRQLEQLGFFSPKTKRLYLSHLLPLRYKQTIKKGLVDRFIQ